MSDEATILQRLSEASHSSDLSHRHTRCDADWLHGAGMAAQRQKLGHALLTLDRTMDAQDIPAALNATVILIRQLAARYRWPMHPLKARRIAVEVLKMYISPACPACLGRGATGVDRNVPAEYNPRTCMRCDGTGKRQPPLKHRREIREALYVMNQRRHEVGAAVRRAMGVRGDVE